VHFIPVSSIKGKKTPDLGADDFEGRTLLCDVKTINISDNEVRRRQSGGVGTSSNRLDIGFLGKLKADLGYAKTQMLLFNSERKTRKIAFVIVNYDDNLHAYSDDYLPQIKQFLANNLPSDLEIQLDIKPPFYLAHG